MRTKQELKDALQEQINIKDNNRYDYTRIIDNLKKENKELRNDLDVAVRDHKNLLTNLVWHLTSKPTERKDQHGTFKGWSCFSTNPSNISHNGGY